MPDVTVLDSRSCLDPSLLSLVERLIPLATYYTSVEASMESRNTTEFGMVSHALCSGIRSMLKVSYFPPFANQADREGI
jgi:hypothetical protein